MLQTDIVALSPRVKKAFFANLAAGIQAIKEATQITATDESAQQTVRRQLSHAKQVRPLALIFFSPADSSCGG